MSNLFNTLANMKTCSKCKIPKLKSEFGKNASRKDGLQAWCKLCKGAHHQMYYQDNKSLFAQHGANSRTNLKEWANAIKRPGCYHCGEFEDAPPCVKHWHHRDAETKVMEVSNMVHTGRSKDAILEEIDKCDLLCVVCHTYLTNGEMEAYRSRMSLAARLLGP